MEVRSWRSGLGLGGIDRRPADDLTHLAGLLRQRPHLRLHIFAVQPHYFGEIFGMEQRLRIIQRCLHVLFGIGNRLGADVLGAGANRRALLLDRACSLLRAGEEFLKGLAGLSKLASAIDRISFGISKRSRPSSLMVPLLFIDKRLRR